MLYEVITMADPKIMLLDEPSLGLSPLLVKPLNLDEVRSHIAGVFRKVDTAKQVVEEKGAVSGSLDQVSMADLLQIFSVNRLV